ncbi:hypothetical protein GCM10011380_36190 [Sphingomonas metalli]|uniref:C-type lysozyme inhibitor domain-containing protein n=1 Tax=Sphingomonas metalli TaxID=1779358 RepID=A0A916TG25_9SPHN|nr:hypothetical protein [Sphingomonas metalli]GGB43508.1 hypothetical protein GCM10011380_36190 [Sphingomonas metalli]
MAARLIKRSPARWIIILLGLGLTPALLGCSPSTDNGDSDGSRDRRLPNFIGEHFYACPDGSRLDVDFVGDGLTLDIKTSPNAAPVRVSSPASGLTYVGPNLNVTISGGDRITLLRPDVPPLACKRVQSRTAPP